MPTLNDGKFSFDIPTVELSRGLRPTSRNPRNSKFLVECVGAVGRDNVLQVLDDLSEDQIDTSALTADFPYPQLFIFKNLIVVCTSTKIYEIVAGVLTERLSVTAGLIWSAVEFDDFIYMSNGKVAVKRSFESKAWATTTDYPIASTICDYNGQIFVGAPGVEWV